MLWFDVRHTSNWIFSTQWFAPCSMLFVLLSSRPYRRKKNIHEVCMYKTFCQSEYIFIIYCCSTKALWFFSMVRKLLSSIWMDWILNWVFGAEKYDKSIYTKRERESGENKKTTKSIRQRKEVLDAKYEKKDRVNARKRLHILLVHCFAYYCCIAAMDGAKQQRILAILG